MQADLGARDVGGYTAPPDSAATRRWRIAEAAVVLVEALIDTALGALVAYETMAFASLFEAGPLSGWKGDHTVCSPTSRVRHAERRDKLTRDNFQKVVERSNQFGR